MNHLLLYLLVREIAPLLEGRRLSGLRRLDPLVVAELRDGRGKPVYLVVLVANPGPFLWLSDRDPLAGGDGATPKRRERLGDAIMKRIEGRTIAHPIEPPHNRVLRLPLNDDGDIRELAIYLYGSAAKIRVQTADTIVESLDNDEAGTPTPHTFGQSRPTLVDIDAEALPAAIAATTSPAKAAPGLESELAAAFSPGGRLDAASLISFRDELVAGSTPFCLATGGRLGRAVPLPVNAAPAEGLGPFTSALEATLAVGSAMLPIACAAIVSHAAAPLRRRLQSRQKLLEKLRREAAAAERFESDRTEADILAAFQTQVPAGASEVELPDLYNDGETRRIALDPALPVREQIQRRYKLAAKRERGRAAIAARIAQVEQETTALESVIEDATAASLPESLRELARAMKRFRIRKPDKPSVRATTEKTYRRFDLENGWFVLVGRSDKENDEITFRVARPDDIWMHAQHVPGSHIVLKCLGKPGNPSDRILETAASIAAHFSKARHSNLVPVIWTRRKYVRKFRGARVGQVTCEREKTIFAPPALPD